MRGGARRQGCAEVEARGGVALAARFAKCKVDGSEVHYGAQLRKGLMVVAA